MAAKRLFANLLENYEKREVVENVENAEWFVGFHQRLVPDLELDGARVVSVVLGERQALISEYPSDFWVFGSKPDP